MESERSTEQDMRTGKGEQGDPVPSSSQPAQNANAATPAQPNNSTGPRVFRIPITTLFRVMDGDASDEDLEEGNPPISLLHQLLSSREGFMNHIEDLQMEMAMRLSLQEFEQNQMSYDNLSSLEDVKVPASPELIEKLPRFRYNPETCSENKCSICQDEFSAGDSLIRLKCSHVLHEECGTSWLSMHSKRCPLCKHEHE